MESNSHNKQLITRTIRKRNLLGDNVLLFEDLSPELLNKVSTSFDLDSIEPIILLIENDNLTVLGAQKICSFFGGEHSCALLRDIKGRTKLHLNKTMTENESKLYSDKLYLPEVGVSVWAPPGNIMMNLISILEKCK